MEWDIGSFDVHSGIWLRDVTIPPDGTKEFAGDGTSYVHGNRNYVGRIYEYDASSWSKSIKEMTKQQ